MGRRRTRLPALAALLAVFAAAAGVVLLGGESRYEVTARFQTASQLVKGNVVQVGGRSVGKVKRIEVAENWQADVVMEIDEDVAPLRVGTQAVIRQASLSGVANRFVDLHLPPGDEQRTIPGGGRIPATQTRAAVELDELFATLGPRERKGLQDVVQGLAGANRGRSEELDRGLKYLPAAIGEQGRLFAELGRDEKGLEDFVVESAGLARTVAERRDDLSGLVREVADFTGAIARRRDDLGETLERLPPFMRRANTTFVGLRAALDDLDPLIRESRPVAERLGPLLAELRPFARDARPALRDLATAVSRPGADNDLVEATRSNVPLRDVLTRTARRNGADRPGALPISVRALRDSREPLAHFRAYSPDLLGWFDDFSHTGIYDAFGGMARIGIHTSAFALVNGTVLAPVPPQTRPRVFDQVASTGQTRRCPGGSERPAEDGSNAGKPHDDFNCDPAQRPPGR